MKELKKPIRILILNEELQVLNDKLFFTAENLSSDFSEMQCASESIDNCIENISEMSKCSNYTVDELRNSCNNLINYKDDYDCYAEQVNDLKNDMRNLRKKIHKVREKYKKAKKDFADKKEALKKGNKNNVVISKYNTAA